MAAAKERPFYRAALWVFARLPIDMRRLLYRRLSPRWMMSARCLVRLDDGRILLIRHRHWNDWGLPGGVVNRGELTQRAAAREVAEETGLRVRLRSDEPFPMVQSHGRAIELVYDAELEDEVKPEDAYAASVEVSEVGWFALNELPPLAAVAALDRRAHVRRRIPRVDPPHLSTLGVRHLECSAPRRRGGGSAVPSPSRALSSAG